RLAAYLPAGALIVAVEPRESRDNMERLTARAHALYEELTHAKEPLPAPDELLAPVATAWRELGAGRSRVNLRQFAEVAPGLTLSWPAKPVRYGAGEFPAFLKDLGRWREQATAAVVFCESPEEHEALAARLKEAAAADPRFTAP